MNKEFIPYEESLELKELGFDEPCFAYWDGDIIFVIDRNSKVIQKNSNYVGIFQGVISAPTFSQAFRFFREKYKLEASIQRMPPEIYGKSKGSIKNYLLYIWAENLNPRGQQTLHFDTYEEAELECLRKLIEIVKNDSNTASERKN